MSIIIVRLINSFFFYAMNNILETSPFLLGAGRNMVDTGRKILLSPTFQNVTQADSRKKKRQNACFVCYSQVTSSKITLM